MLHAKLRTVAAATLTLTTWTFVAGAQEAPNTDPPMAPEISPRTTPTTPTTPADPVTVVQTEAPTTLALNPSTATYDKTTYPNRPLLITSFALLGATYGASVIGAAISDKEYNDKLYYPVAGPWLALHDRDCDRDPCDHKTLNTTLLVGSGVLQGIGAFGMLMSLVVPEKSTRSWYLIGNHEVAVTPVAGTTEVGAMAVGRF